MGCGCNKGRARSYLWTSDPDPETGETITVEKRTEVEAAALVIRKGGSFEAVTTK